MNIVSVDLIRASLRLIIPVSLVILGVVVGVVSILYPLPVPDRSAWVEVPAEITYTYSVHAYGGRQGSGIEYVPKPSYTFTTLEGVQYRGSMYSTSFETTRDLDFIDGQTETPVTIWGSIFYNPDDPNQSAVKKPSDPIYPISFILLFPFLMIIIGSVILLERWSNREFHKAWWLFRRE